jgi:ribosome maturation factor RimP
LKVGWKPAFFLRSTLLKGSAIRDAVVRLAEGVALQEGLELVDVDLAGTPGRYMLRVYIDKEGGVSIGDCSSFSKSLSAILDVEDPVPTKYFLEVSSPGLDRVLRQPGHFRRVVGRVVKVKFVDPQDGRKQIVGILQDVADMGIVLKVNEEYISVGYGNIKKANLKGSLDEEGDRKRRKS